jgi:HPt (histidine-containing phosphotransfer) domain-containing protein
MTANALSGDREECLAAGMDDYLSKPYTSTQLSELLGRWVPQLAEEASNPQTPAPTRSGASCGLATGSPDEEAAPALDAAVLGAIRGMDPEGTTGFFERVVDSYLGNARADLQGLADAERAGDLESMRKCAHRLKSASANLGARALAARCQELESLARAGDLGAARPLLGTLRSELERVRAALDLETRTAA